MIPEIKKILYTTDLSKNARHAFGYAMGLANRYSAGITILHVLEDVSPYADSLVINILGKDKWEELRKNNTEELVNTIKDRLKNFCDEAIREIPECPFITNEILVKIGIPIDEILREANKSDYDLIIMGAHGHGILGDAMMGSTSRKVLRRCKKPVLVVRLPEKEDE